MDNYKITASVEAVSLFSDLGYDVSGLSKESEFLFAKSEDMSVYNYVLEEKGYQELTLPQLRDLVVLKRGDANDANVYEDTECSCLYNLYLTADRELYFYHCGKEKWITSSLNHDEDYYATLKPIEKSQPQTIKLELEIPAPYKAKIGGRDDASFVLNVGRHQYCYKTEEDYTKARDALEAVFDAAVRGTNS